MGHHPPTLAPQNSSLQQTTRRLVLGTLLTASWSGWLGGCDRRDLLRIAGHPWPGYEPLFFAQSQGKLPPELVIQDMPSIKASIDALKEGRADGAMLTLDEALALQVNGMALTVVLVFDVSKGADVLLARPEVTKLEQLRGKVIGLESSALGELMLAMILEKAGLARSDITPKFIDFTEQEAAWTGSKVDALITYEPVAGRLAAKSAHRLLSTRQLPDTIFDVLAIKTEVAQKHGDTLRKGLRAHFAALEELRRNPWDTAYRMAPHLGIPAEELIDSLRGLELPDIVANRSYLAPKIGRMATVTPRLSRIMQAAGILIAPAQSDTLFSDAYLPGDASS